MSLDEASKIRMQYSGAVGLLADLALQVDEESRESIEQAVEDWCKITGWTWKRTLSRISLNPPKETS